MSEPHCPKCGRELKGDYGMMPCPSCGTVVFIDLHGNAQVSAEGPQESVEVHVLPEMVEEEQIVPTFEAPAPQGEFIEPRSAAETPENSAAEFSMDDFLGKQEAPQDAAHSADPDIGRPGDPLGLNEYSNSEISQAKDGPLTFKILISGVDSKEMRESLRSALDDQRFGWNANDLMSRIVKGHLQLDNVAPVKAVILLNRIKRLAVKVRWEQYAITQMDI